MAEPPPSQLASIVDFLRTKVLENVWVQALSAYYIVGGAVSYFLDDLPLSVIAMLALPAASGVVLAVLCGATLYRDIRGRARLELLYDPTVNYLLHGSGDSEVRFRVHNASRRDSAKAISV